MLVTLRGTGGVTSYRVRPEHLHHPAATTMGTALSATNVALRTAGKLPTMSLLLL